MRLLYFVLLLVAFVVCLIATVHHVNISHVRRIAEEMHSSDERDAVESFLERQDTKQSVIVETLLARLRQPTDKVTLLEKKTSSGRVNVAIPVAPKALAGLTRMPRECSIVKGTNPDDILQPIREAVTVAGEQCKLVVLITAFRSGSSFVGEMFAESDELMYLFEPFYLLQKLFPDMERSLYDEMKIDLLKSMLTCRFDSSKLGFWSIQSAGQGNPFP
jgi:hypothetical protein